MTTQEAKKILTLYRPGSVDAKDPEFSEALLLARQDAELKGWLDEHYAVQSAIRERFKGIAVPEGLTWQADQHETPGIALVSYASNLLRARLHFAEADRVAWSFTFDAVGASVD